MTPFYRFDIVHADGDTPRKFKVIWLDGQMLVFVDVDDPSSWPCVVNLRTAERLLDEGVWTVETGRAPEFPLPRDVKDKHLAKRDELWLVIEPIVVDLPVAFDKSKRAKRINEVLATADVSRNTVYEALLRYFHGGCDKAALVPKWNRCGALGILRNVADGAVKRGRPPAPGMPDGVNIDERLRRLFRQAILLCFRRNRRASIKDAYVLCVQEWLSEVDVDPETGRDRRIALPEFRETGLPTFSQFDYWYRRDNDLLDIGRERARPRVWDMKFRALTSTAMAQVMGPASRYEIDATVLDEYCRSRADCGQLIGRPTLYVVIDVWSRMIVGIYIGLESPSYVAAMMALANVIEDKVAFCARFGVEIEPWQWPVCHLPGALLGDRAEMLSAKVDALLNHYHVDVENAAAYRADWKGTVEQVFRTLQVGFKPWVDGYVDTDYRRRGVRDYRLDANLNIDELTRIILRLVLLHNNHRVMKDFPRYPGQVEDGVPSRPLDIWNHGIATLTGRAREPDPERFRFALMPVAKARVTGKGIRFQGRFYSCPTALRDAWFERARAKGERDIQISFDKRDVDRIYVHQPDSPGFEVARLMDRSLEAAGLTGWEAHALEAQAKVNNAAVRDEEILVRADILAEATKITEEGRRRADAADKGRSDRSRVTGLRAARTEETERERRAEALAFRPDGEKPQIEPASADVLVLRPSGGGAAAPSMRERLTKLNRPADDE